MNESDHVNCNDDFDESWILNLQELLETLEPQVRQSNALKILEDFLSSLESTDRNFHKYSFIRQIRKKLEFDLSPLIDELIRNHEILSGDNMLASDVSETLTQSEQFVKTSTCILDCIRMAAENLTEHLNSDTFDFSIHGVRIDDKDKGHGYESMCSNDGMDLLFMSPNHYKTLAKDLDPVNSLDIRLKSLTALQQVPQTDLLASDAWGITRRGLLCALDDENEEVHIQALTFLSNLFVSGSSHVVKEYFMILIENMIEYFNDSTSHMVSVESGLDLGDRRNVYLLRKFRLLNQIQEELPSNWLRYSEKYIEEIIQYVFQLLQFIPTPISDTIGQNLLTPLHFLALLDPLATWFKYWMHGLYGRSKILKSLNMHSNFLLDPIEVCIHFSTLLKDVDFNQFHGTQNDEEFVYTSADICYTYFLHSISIIGRLMLYKDSFPLLNVTLSDGKVVNRKTIVLSFIEILKLFPLSSLNLSKSLYHPVFLIVDIFSSFVHNGVDTCKEYLCNEEVCNALFEMIRDFNENFTNVDKAVINVIADILAEIASTDCGRSYLIYSEMHTSFNMVSPIHLIAKGLCFLLEEPMHDNLTINSICALMSLCCQVYMTCEGINVLKQYNLNKKIFSCITSYKAKLKVLSDKFKNPSDPDQELTTGSLVSFRKLPNQDQVIYKCYMNLVKEMLDNLLNFCHTPQGVELVAESGGLNDCVIYLFDKCKLYEQHSSKIDKFGCEMIISQLSVTSAGVAALNKAGYVASLLDQLWSHLEGYSNDYTRIILPDIPEDLNHRVSKKLFVSIVKLLSNFDAIYEVFGKLKPSINVAGVIPDEDISIKRIKRIGDFHEFFTNLILIDSYDKQSLLSHPEQTHFFSLNVLACIITCLDTMLYLEAMFHLKQSLLSMQALCKLESNTFMIDQCSVKRNQILVMVHVLGGVSERFVPPDNLTQDSASPYPWPLFSSYPLPDVYTLKVPNPAIGPSKKKSSFESYLSEIESTDWLQSGNQKEVIEAIRVMYMEEAKSKLLKSSDKILQKLMDVVISIYVADNKYKVQALEEKISRPTKLMKVTESDEVAIDMVARYGYVVRAVPSVAEANDFLKALILQWKSYVCDSQMLSQGTEFKGFDWFVALIGLMFSDKKNSALEFLKTLSSLVHFRCIWFSRFPSTREKHERNPIHPIFSKVCHYVELLLQKELPQIYAAFRLSGCSPSQICYLWYRQCFLNYMDWGDIVWYISTCIVMGIDYQIYFTLAVFKHLEEDILFHTQSNDLVLFVKTVPLKSFYFAQYIDFMKRLELDYRATIMEELFNS